MKTEFDIQCENFTQDMRVVSDWKNHFYGAAYSTRLQSAIQVARTACAELEAWMKENNEWYELPLFP